MPDPLCIEHFANCWVVVSLVSDNAFGAMPWAPTAQRGHLATFNQLRNDRTLVLLTSGQDEVERPAFPFGPEVDLGREAPAAVSERFIVWAPFFAPAAWA